jgi:hypothetical protein
VPPLVVMISEVSKFMSSLFITLPRFRNSYSLDQIRKNDIMAIPVTGLKTEEIREFDSARTDWLIFNKTP